MEKVEHESGPSQTELQLYTPLNSERREIRLVTLLPGRWAEEIECELKIESLDGSPIYQALSYACGDTSIKHSIFLNKRPFGVGTNLLLALRRLRELSVTRVLWIDAISIRQDDVSERSQQVSLMGDIFKSSSEALFWFGESGILDGVPLEEQRTWDEAPRTIWHGDKDKDFQMVSDTFESFKELKAPEMDSYTAMLYRRALRMNRSATGSGFLESRQDYLRRGLFEAFTILFMLVGDMHIGMISQLIKFDDTDCFQILETILDAEWWNRTWTLQEALLPPSATVIYGNVQFPWKWFVTAGSRCAEHAASCCSTFMKNGLPGHGYNTLQRMWRQISDASRLDGSSKLLEVLEYTRIREATDERDKVYAILSLVTDWQGMAPLLPDYSQNLVQVYARATVQMIKASNAFKMWIYTFPTISRPGIPSWSHGYFDPTGLNSRNNSRWRTDSHLWRSFHTLNGKARECTDLFSACGIYKSATAELVSDSILAITGKLIDTVSVQESSPPPTSLFDDFGETAAGTRFTTGFFVQTAMALSGHKKMETLDTILSRLKEFRRLLMSKKLTSDYVGGGTLDNAFRRLMIGDISHVKTTPLSYRRASPEDLVAFDRWLITDHPDDYTEIFLEPTGNTGHSEDVLSWLSLWMASKAGRYFITKKGFLGQGPLETQEGDQIWVIQGGSVPFIFRPASEEAISSLLGQCRDNSVYYTLIGHCYIHGVMDGEAILNGPDGIQQVFLV